MKRDQILAYMAGRGLTLAQAQSAIDRDDVRWGPEGILGWTVADVPAPASRDLPTESEAAAILAPYTKAQRLAAVRQQATAIIQANLPQPWDVLRHLASPEFIAWADDYLGLVAAELTRLETAIETDQEAIPDWPEVE